MRLKLGLGKKLILGFTMFVLFMAGLSLYSVKISSKSLKESVGKDSIFLVEEMLKRMDRDIYFKIEELQKQTKHLILQKALFESNREFEKLDNIQEYINQRDQEWVSQPKETITSFMQGLINNKVSEEMTKEFIEFYEKKYGYRIVGEIFITNRYGANVAQTGKTSDYRQDDEKWWQVAKNKGLYVSDVEFDESAGTHAISVGIRIENDDGEFMGVMKAVIAVSGIIREAEIVAKKYETTEIKLITKDGRLVYATEPFKFLEDVTKKEFFKRIEGSKGFFVKKEEGRQKLFSYGYSKGYRNFEGLQWVLIVEYDEKDILNPIFILRKRIFVISALVIALSISIAIFISFPISGQIKKLTKAAKEISTGKLDLKIYSKDFSSTPEIGVLAQTFDQMAESLKQREEALKESKERFEDLYENAPDGYYSLDGKGMIIEANNTFVEMLGYSKRELKENHTSILFSEEAKDKFDQLFSRLKEEGIIDQEVKFVKKNGKELYVRFRGIAKDSEDKFYLEYKCAVRDITERKKVEERLGVLYETGKKITSIVSKEELLPWIAEQAARLLDADECLYRIREGDYLIRGGGTKKGMELMETKRLKIGQSFSGIIVKEKRPLISKDMREDERYKKEHREVAKRLGLVSFLGVPMCIEGRVVGVLNIMSKKTRKFTEADIELLSAFSDMAAIALENMKLFEDLGKEIAERKLAEKRLKKTMAQLSSSNKELEQFAYVTSHDLQEPLRMIASYLQLIERRYKDKLDKDGKEFIYYAVDGAKRMKELIIDILSFSRVGTKGKPFQSTDCKDVLEHVLANLNPVIEDSGAKITYNHLPTVMADDSQLVQLFQNLIGNSIKFRSKDSPHIDIKAKPEDSEWIFSVKDNGIGMEKQFHERIFRIFQRLHTKEEFSGTGIGLAICKKIVERHGGRIWVESEPNNGATFFFTIPIKGGVDL